MLSNSSDFHFVLIHQGRIGRITCTKGEEQMDLEWEMSGSRDYDLLLAPISARAWKSGLALDQEEQLKLLDALRIWLKNQRLKSNLDVPMDTRAGKTCLWSACAEPSRFGSFYCAQHYDLQLLR